MIYKQGGKLYMMEDSANEKASSQLPEVISTLIIESTGATFPLEANVTGASGAGNRLLAFD